MTNLNSYPVINVYIYIHFVFHQKQQTARFIFLCALMDLWNNKPSYRFFSSFV